MLGDAIASKKESSDLCGYLSSKAGGVRFFVQPKTGFGLPFSGNFFCCLNNSGDLVRYKNDAEMILKLFYTTNTYHWHQDCLS